MILIFGALAASLILVEIAVSARLARLGRRIGRSREDERWRKVAIPLMMRAAVRWQRSVAGAASMSFEVRSDMGADGRLISLIDVFDDRDARIVHRIPVPDDHADRTASIKLAIAREGERAALSLGDAICKACRKDIPPDALSRLARSGGLDFGTRF